MNKVCQGAEGENKYTLYQKLLDTGEKRKKLVQAGHLHWVHWLVVGLSVLLTLAAWYFSKEQVLQKVEQQFEREAEQTIELIKERMALYENALWGGVSLITPTQVK